MTVQCLCVCFIPYPATEVLGAQLCGMQAYQLFLNAEESGLVFVCRLEQ